MSEDLEPLLAAKETKNKPTKYRSTRDAIVDGWLMLMKRYLGKAHAKDPPLDKAWTITGPKWEMFNFSRITKSGSLTQRSEFFPDP